MEHVGGTCLEVEGIVWLIKHLLIFLKMERLFPHHGLTLDPECINEQLHLFFRAYQTLQPANPCRILLTCVDGELYSGHIALGDPIEAI